MSACEGLNGLRWLPKKEGVMMYPFVNQRETGRILIGGKGGQAAPFMYYNIYLSAMGLR